MTALLPPKKRSLLSDEEKQFIRDNLWVLGAIECAKRLSRPKATIYVAAKRLKVPTNPIFRFSNLQDISHITSLTDPFVIYFLGLVWADGTISTEKRHCIKLKINKPDFSYIKQHVSCLGDFWRYNEYVVSNKPHWKPMSTLTAIHLDLWRFLEAHDYRIKSGASADKILAAIPEHLRHYWWRGYFDGDGGISSRRMCFNSGMNQDWAFVDAFGQQLKIDFTIERKDRGTRAGSKAVIGRWAHMKILIDYLYQGEDIGFDRKRKACFDYLAKYTNPAKKPNLTSRYRGVSKRGERFVMQINSGDRYLYRRFDREEDAARAYDALAKESFGNKAQLNFP